MPSHKEKIDELIEILKRTSSFDSVLVSDLALLLANSSEVKADFLVQLLASKEVSIRVAAVRASEKRSDGEIFTALTRLAEDADVRVRRALAAVVGSLPVKRFQKTFHRLFQDSDPDVRVAVLKSSHGKQDFMTWQQNLLSEDENASVRLAAAEALNSRELTVPFIVDDLFTALAVDVDSEVRLHCADLIDRRLAKDPNCGELITSDFSIIEKARDNFGKLFAASYPALSEWFKKHLVKPADSDELARYGTELSLLAEKGTLPHAFGVESVRDIVLKILLREGSKAIVLLGATGVGKSAVVNELVYELLKPENGAWRVLRVSPTEFMMGTKYLGEWETRVNNLVKAVRQPCHVILYIPNLGELVGMGRWSQSQANVATALAPHIQDGSIVVIGESTPEEYASGMGSQQALNRLFDKLLIEPATENLTRQILTRVKDENKVEISDAVIDSLIEVSDQYLNQSARPGNAVTLLRDVIASHAGSTEPVTTRTVLSAVSKSTGIPVDFLDDAIPLDLGDVRNFFEKRIMGQPEAVDSVIDLLMLIKSGLTDQNKPFGVFLFIGPTGVGKTELARALAEYVFGDASRLQRFDMSEFASYEGFERLIGVGGPGLLTEAVRQKPFSVILLDEIEKGHTNVFDLCLQLFDAGRLTDGQGRTVDFRRTIVILTSNIGAQIGSDMVLGFGSSTQSPSSDERLRKDRTMRELSRAFRPEFLNRIDRIVNFRPLSLQVAESIARREIDNVLKRSGITRRHLAVDIDPSVITALLKEGYSQSFGARPLKRAVERMLLLPLAKAISTGRISGRAVLSLSATGGNKIDVKIVSSAEEKKKAPPVVRSNNSLLDLSQELIDGIAALEDHIVPMSERKSELLHEIHKPDFYQDHQAKAATFDEIHKLDQFLATYEGLCKVVYGISERLSRPVSRNEEPALLERINQLGSELEHLSFIATSADTQDLGDALVCIRLVDRTNESLSGVDTLVKMYIGYARRRRLTVEVISEFSDDTEESVYVHVVGLGAYALFKNEIGLHQFDNHYKSRNGKDRHRTDREVVRVEVMPMDEEQPGKSFISKVKQTVKQSKIKSGQFIKRPEYEISLFHEPSIRSFRGLFAGEKESAINMANMILHTIVEDQDGQDVDYIVRYYDFGSVTKVRDARSGKTTSRIDQVLKGNLDLFIRSVD